MQQLREICKTCEISYYGTKANTIERIKKKLNEYEEAKNIEVNEVADKSIEDESGEAEEIRLSKVAAQSAQRSFRLI